MKNQNKKIYYSIGLIMLIVLLLIFGAILPLLAKIKNAGFNLTKNQTATKNIYADWLSLQISEKDLNKINREKLEKNFLDADRPLDFILDLENSSQKANLQHEIKIFTLSPGQAKEKSETVPFQLILWGSFPNFIHFLNYFENMPYYAEIDSLQINRLTKDNLTNEKIPNLTEGDVKINLNIRVYAKL